jgi:hypothetical protein
MTLPISPAQLVSHVGVPPNNSLQLTRLACGKLELVLPAKLL